MTQAQRDIQNKPEPHTPGPWRLLAHTRSPVVQRGVEGGFVVRGLSAERERADAHLIAAAPDLLAALRDAVNIITEDGKLVFAGVHGRAITRMRAAIARAEGREP